MKRFKKQLPISVEARIKKESDSDSQPLFKYLVLEERSYYYDREEAEYYDWDTYNIIFVELKCPAPFREAVEFAMSVSYGSNYDYEWDAEEDEWDEEEGVAVFVGETYEDWVSEDKWQWTGIGSGYHYTEDTPIDVTPKVVIEAYEDDEELKSLVEEEKARADETYIVENCD